MQNLLRSGNYSNKRKSQGKDDRVHPQAQNLRILIKIRKLKRSGRKRKGKSPSLSSNVSSSDSRTDSKSEDSVTNKRFKVILKGEEFKWNLPSSMAEYANHRFILRSHLSKFLWIRDESQKFQDFSGLESKFDEKKAK